MIFASGKLFLFMQSTLTIRPDTGSVHASSSRSNVSSILHIVTDMDPTKGGVCQSVRTMIAGLTQLGVHNELVSLDNPDAPYNRADNFIIHARGEGKGPWRYNPAYRSWLLENIHRFDVLVVHGIWLYHTYSARKALSDLKARSAPGAKMPKLFIMPHGMLDPYFQGAGGRKLKAARNWLYWKLLEGKNVNSADGMLFTSESERVLARKPFSPYQPKREWVVGLGIEEPPVSKPAMQDAFLAKCPGVANHTYLLFLGRVHEKKGVELLVEAYKNERKKMNSVTDNSFPALVIAGPGLDTAYGQDVQQRVKASPSISSHVFFPGMLEGPAKWGAFYGCNAFVLPSHQENFGIAVVEAMACGKPVLISNQVNIWQPITAGGAGLAADDNYEGTLELLQKWTYLSPEEQRMAGLNARNCFEKEFAMAPASRRLLDAVSADTNPTTHH